MAGSTAAESTPAMDDFLQEARWPDALPPHGAKLVLSVVCGNSRLHWALHLGAAENFMPTLFWRTEPPGSGTTLAQYVPEEVKDSIFGTPEDHEVEAVECTTENAVEYRVTQKIPALYIYVVSTNPKNVQGLASLFRRIPCNLYLLSADDFSGGGDSVIYKGMGVDRVANVAGAKFLVPNAQSYLVIDGGTAMTYTATTLSKNNKIQLSGGIGPGLRMKFRSLYEYTGNLPYVGLDSLKSIIEQCQKERKPIPLFVTGSEDEEVKNPVERSIAGSVLQETALLLCYVIRDWLASKCPKESDKGLPTVILTGGDCDILEMLLQPEHSNIVEINGANRELLETGQPVEELSETNGKSDPNKRFQIAKNSHLIHCGIKSVLTTNQIRDVAVTEGTEGPDPDENLRNRLLGQRVAVPDPTSTKDQSKCLYGTIISSIWKRRFDDSYFSVFYDESGAIDDLSVTATYDALLRYTKTPEHKNVKTELRKMRLANKAKDAEEALKLLVEKSKAVQNLVESRKPKKRPPPAPAKPSNGDKTGQEQSAKKNKTNPDESTAPAVTIDGVSTASKDTFNPRSWIGRRTAKYFNDDELFYGSIREFTPASENEDKIDLWGVVYDDNDCEDLEKDEIMECLSLYRKNEAGDPKKSS